MRKVQIIETGEIKQVDNNEAHTLIDSGVAKIYNVNPNVNKTGDNVYNDRMMKAGRGKAYGTKVKRAYDTR